MPFVYDESIFITNQKCFIVKGNNMAYLAAYFNSSLFNVNSTNLCRSGPGNSSNSC